MQAGREEEAIALSRLGDRQTLKKGVNYIDCAKFPLPLAKINFKVSQPGFA
ncbi:MAG: hypothetical protein ACR2LR_17160 [Hassallia sp.]